MDAKPEVCEVCGKPASEDRRLRTVTRTSRGKPVLFRVHVPCIAELDASPLLQPSELQRERSLEAAFAESRFQEFQCFTYLLRAYAVVTIAGQRATAEFLCILCKQGMMLVLHMSGRISGTAPDEPEGHRECPLARLLLGDSTDHCPAAVQGSRRSPALLSPPSHRESRLAMRGWPGGGPMCWPAQMCFPEASPLSFRQMTVSAR
jgi:hypothetical protein